MEDLELTRETLKNTKYLKSKYPRWRIEELADILEISEMYGIPIKEFYSYSFGYFLNGGHGFNFEILKNPLLTNSKTHYKPSVYNGMANHTQLQSDIKRLRRELTELSNMIGCQYGR